MDNYSNSQNIFSDLDLSSPYNIDVLALLPQTPHCLFTYWEITDKKRNSFKTQFGNNSWETSRPVIKVVNLTKNYHFFLEISDKTDKWYINVADCNCHYNIQIGRRLAKGIFVELLFSNICFAPPDSIIESSNSKVCFTNKNHVKLSGASTNVFTSPDKIVTAPISVYFRNAQGI